MTIHAPSINYSEYNWSSYNAFYGHRACRVIYIIWHLKNSACNCRAVSKHIITFALRIPCENIVLVK